MNGVQHKVVGTGFGIAGAYVFCKGYGDPMGAFIAVSSMVGCMLPDIDHDMTKIGRKRKVVTELGTKAVNALILVAVATGLILTVMAVKGFQTYGINPQMAVGIAVGGVGILIAKKIIGNSKTFKWATKHRGLMHTLFVPALLIAGLNVSSYPLWRYAVLGLCIGYISHLFADMLTVEGCPILFPLTKNNIHLMSFKTKDPICTKVAWFVAILACVISYFVTGHFIS